MDASNPGAFIAGICGELGLTRKQLADRIGVTDNAVFTAAAKGLETRISYEKGGKKTEPFGVPEADDLIELNGIKSELVICARNEGK